MLPEVGSRCSLREQLQAALRDGGCPAAPGGTRKVDLCRSERTQQGPQSSRANAPCMQAPGQQGLRPSSGDPEVSALPGSGTRWIHVRVGLSSACLSDVLIEVAAILHPLLPFSEVSHSHPSKAPLE